MMGLSMQHILLWGVVALLLFGGRGKISEIMGDFAKGIKSFKKGMADETEDKAAHSTMATIEIRQAVETSKDREKVG